MVGLKWSRMGWCWRCKWLRHDNVLKAWCKWTKTNKQNPQQSWKQNNKSALPQTRSCKQTHTQKKKTKKRRTHHVLESWHKKNEFKNTFPRTHSHIIISNTCTKHKIQMHECMD